MPLYAAYGSNLDPRHMAEQAPHSPPAGTGWLVDWRLAFGGDHADAGGALMTVVEELGSQVFVMLYDVTAADERELDVWEGAEAGLYRKLRMRVHTLDGEVTAWLYVLDAYEGGLPSARYLGLMADCAEAAGAPDDYVAELRLRPCRPDRG
jgi:hypothetical protein